MRILVADDDPVSRSDDGTHAREERVRSDDRSQWAAGAVRTVKEDGPRLALIDWMMPELDGPGVCREVRSRSHDALYVYILLLTSRQLTEDVVKGLEAGADDYLTKPCHPAELQCAIAYGPAHS